MCDIQGVDKRKITPFGYRTESGLIEEPRSASTTFRQTISSANMLMTRVKGGIKARLPIQNSRLRLTLLFLLLSCLDRLCNFVSMLRLLIIPSRSLVSIVSDLVNVKLTMLIFSSRWERLAEDDQPRSSLDWYWPFHVLLQWSCRPQH